MSSVAGPIKQQCPSCGGQITIKATLVGKKIDCPKCKFRFIVEGDDGAEEDVKTSKKSAVASKKAGKNGAAPGKSKGRPRDDEDDDEEPRFKKKGAKEGSNKALLILAGVGVLLVVVVGIIIVVVATSSGGGGGPTQPSGSGVAKGPGSGAPSQPTQTPEQAMSELVGKLENAADKDQAKTELLGKLEGEDATARDLAFSTLKDKALNGSEAAFDVIRSAAASSKEDVKTKAGELVTEITTQLAKGQEGLKDDPTNMLPIDTQIVLSIPVRKFIDSTLGLAVLARGAFRLEDFDRRLGIECKNIEQLVIGCNKDHTRTLAVVRTMDPMIWDDVSKAMHLDEKSKQVVKGKEYFAGTVDLLNEFLKERMKPVIALKSRAFVCKHDDRTLLIGDEVTIKNWLTERPPFQVAPPAPPADQGQPGGAPDAGTGEGALPGQPAGAGAGIGPAGGPAGAGAGIGQPAGAGAGIGQPAGAGAGVGGPPAGLGGKGPMGSGGPFGPMGPGGPMGPTGPAGAPGSSLPPQLKEKTFLTLTSKLRQVIDKAQNQKSSMVLFAEAASSKESQSPVANLTYFKDLARNQLRQLEIVALALQLEDHLVLRVAAACKETRASTEIRKDLESILKKAAKEELKEALGFEFQVSDGSGSESPTQPGGGQPFGPGGDGSGNLPPGYGRLGGSGPAGAAGGGGAGAPGLPAAPGGGGAGAPGLPPAGGLGPMGPMGPMGGGFGRGPFGPMGRGGPAGTEGDDQPQPQGPGQPDTHADLSTITVVKQDEFIIVTATVLDKTDPFVDREITPRVIQWRGQMDMSSGRYRIADMPSAVSLYLSRYQDVFPMGAYPRKADPARGGRAWPPSERLSFFRELLPFLGDDRYYELYDASKPDKSWRDPENARIGRVAVPHFLNPSTDKYYTKVRGIDHELAVSHFVGMAGVGPDAPYYDRKDPRAGIFGYDRQASRAEVTDGLSNTILLIQNDPALAGPWIAGGGATVRGTSLKGDRDVGQRGGFMSPNYNGKEGVWVMMADGSIRFLTKNIDPQAFKALCTMAGGDSDAVGDLSALAPEHRLPTTPSTQSPAAGRPTKTADDGSKTTDSATPKRAPKGEEEEEGKPKKPAKSGG